jgi:hypothetical protein
MSNCVCLILCALALGIPANEQAHLPVLSCETFATARSIASLQSAIGSPDVSVDSVPLGATEGDMLPATVFFPTVASRRIEVVWRGGEPERGPLYVRLRGQPTEWRTKDGVSIGTSLRQLERLNGRPFHLVGFGTDAGVNVTSWDGGRLRSNADAQCHWLVRVDSLPQLTPKQRALYVQVTGDRTFSSAHPAMQALNPRVGELLLEFPMERSRVPGAPPAHER